MPGVYFINFLQPKEDLENDIQEVESGIFKGKHIDISYVSLNVSMNLCISLLYKNHELVA